MWMAAAAGSALFAGITAILGKCGMERTDSDVATALRTVVVLVFSWLIAFAAGAADNLARVTPRSLVFLILSGLVTGASWLCYFRALSLGHVNQVAPIDKSSTVLTVLLAMVFFSETDHLPVKLLGTALLAAGTLLMTVGKAPSGTETGRKWLPYAILSALFAALTSILAKVGIDGVESNLATAIRTAVVLVMAWAMVFLKGKQHRLHDLDRRELRFILLSGLATGASWLCYYYAIQNGVVSVVVPIDKMSLLVTVVFSRIFLKETISPRAGVGLGLMLSGTLAMAIWS